MALALLDTARTATGSHRKLTEIVLRYLTLTEVKAGPFTLSVGFAERPLDALDQAMRAIDSQLTQTGGYVVLAVDEVTEVVREIGCNQGPGAAKELLGTLRRIREECTRIRWVLTGSIGFHHVLRELGVTDQALNNLRVFTLGALDPAWASGCRGACCSTNPALDESITMRCPKSSQHELTASLC